MDSPEKAPQDDSLLNEHQKESIQKVYDQAAFEKKTIEELKTEERFQNYFAGYLPSSVETFIKTYAIKKALWYRFGEFWVRQNEAEDLQWINAAAEHLAVIQQKKLFDLQCQWRAEKITLPGVEIGFDFEMWGKDIMACPFLEPVTERDIDLYTEYLSQNNVDLEFRWFHDWQHYDRLKEAYNTEGESGNFPEWYDFHNGRTGAGAFMLLPDTRGEKENFYDHLTRQKEKPEMEARWAESEKLRYKRPFMKSVSDKNFMDWFITTFEDKHTKEYYQADLRYSRSRDDAYSVEANIRLLLKADEPVPISAHYDWKEALQEAVERYRLKKIAEFLPAAFEQYQLNISMGIMPPNEEGNNHYKNIREHWAKNILDGREINGEPRDFNF